MSFVQSAATYISRVAPLRCSAFVAGLSFVALSAGWSQLHAQELAPAPAKAGSAESFAIDADDRDHVLNIVAAAQSTTEAQNTPIAGPKTEAAHRAQEVVTVPENLSPAAKVDTQALALIPAFIPPPWSNRR